MPNSISVTNAIKQKKIEIAIVAHHMKNTITFTAAIYLPTKKDNSFENAASYVVKRKLRLGNMNSD